MTEHTPGPWQTVQEPEQRATNEMYRYVVVADDPDDPLSPWNIAAAFGWVGHQDDPWEQSAANARLIAAAPDLLAACRAVVSAYASGQAYDKCPLDIVKAAIGKAVGDE